MIRRIQEIIKNTPEIVAAVDGLLAALTVIAIVGLMLWLQRGSELTGPQFIDEAFTVRFADDTTLPYGASIHGEKYYPVGCKGIGRIKLENRIYFSSVIEATGAGYTAASGC
ncbi:MAG: hypothetical protein AAB343_00315 [Patescibacteria group bacterium]